MKRFIFNILMVLTLTLWTGQTFGQTATVPPPPGSHGESADQAAGGGAPIGGGLFILLGLGAAYGGKKIYDVRKETLEE